MRAKPLYISYFTNGNGYEIEAAGLINTLNQFNLEYQVCPEKPFSGWQQAAQFKARFIERMMVQFPSRPLVWVDADARIRQYPELFDFIECDAAAHYFRGKELLTGTLFFGGTERALDLVRGWIHENEQFPKGRFGDQKNFQNIVERALNLDFKRLPAPYTLIFDMMKKQGPPIIEHLQASRRLKR